MDEEVYVTGVGSTPFGRQKTRSLQHLAEQAVSAALEDAGVHATEIEACFVANAAGGLTTGQEMIRGQVCLQDFDFSAGRVINVENACASGASAFDLACREVRGGLSEVVLVLGVEKMFHDDRSVPFRALASAVDVAVASHEWMEATKSRSPFMDLYARAARDYLDRTDATVEDFAMVAVKNRSHGMLNPHAQYGKSVSLVEVMGSGAVAEPLTRMMCSPISDGASAIVVSGRQVRRRRGRPSPRVDASVVGSSNARKRTIEWVASKAYEEAGIGPSDIGVFELHDATASAELELYENLGLADPGEGFALIRDGTTALGGRYPVNVSGGLLARGHPIGATGVAQICELTLQLTDCAGDRQVEGARVGLAQNAGGWLNGDHAVAGVSILSRSR